ncbi:MAG: hypothetical protein AAGF31_01400 [Planctomycetota bacterium]
MTNVSTAPEAIEPEQLSAADSPAEELQEYVDSRHATVRLDKASSVLQGVKLLGLASRNGRQYRETALRKAIHLYEGAKVNVNHPAGDPLSPRDYRDRIGVIRGVKHRPGEGLFGALHFNPKHPLAEQLVWDAEHAPENVGFSHNVMARTVRKGQAVVVESIEKVRSVDLVADPATTSDLFEQAESTASQQGRTNTDWDRLTLHELQLHRPDLFAELAEAHQAELAEKQQQIDHLSEREATAIRERRITELLIEHDLPLPRTADPSAALLTSKAFLESLVAAPDDETLQRLVSDRAEALQEASKQRSPVVAREQNLLATQQASLPVDAEAFVAAISRR